MPFKTNKLHEENQYLRWQSSCNSEPQVSKVNCVLTYVSLLRGMLLGSHWDFYPGLPCRSELVGQIGHKHATTCSWCQGNSMWARTGSRWVHQPLLMSQGELPTLTQYSPEKLGSRERSSCLGWYIIVKTGVRNLGCSMFSGLFLAPPTVASACYLALGK